MSEHLVLLVDADVALSERTRAALAPFGCRCVILRDANDVLTTTEVPSLIIFCIDPKRLGWAICNKIKKHPLLRTVPLLITSAEATEKDFDDHRKLKTRAEEYEIKPYPVDRVVDKVRALLGGLEVLVSGEFELPPPDDIALDEDIVVEDAEPSRSDFDDEFSDRTRVGSLAEALSLETDEAFSNLTSEPEEHTRAIAAAPLPPPIPSRAPPPWPPASAPSRPPIPIASPQPPVSMATKMVVPPPLLDDADEPELSVELPSVDFEEPQHLAATPSFEDVEEVEQLAALGPKIERAGSPLVDVHAVRSAGALEAHGAELSQKNEELQALPGSLQNAEAKLTESAQADNAKHDEGNARHARELAEAQAALELRDAQLREVQAAREQLLAEEQQAARAREQLTRSQQGAAAQQLAEAKAESARLKDEHAIALIDNEQRHAEAVARLRTQNDEALAEAEARHQRELVAASALGREEAERLRAEAATQQAELGAAATAREAGHQGVLESLRQSHEAALETELVAREMLKSSLDEQHHAALEAQRAAIEGEHRIALEKLRGSLAEEHAGVAESLRRKHAEELAALVARHNSDRGDLDEKLAARVESLAEIRQTLEEERARIVGFEEQVAALQSEVERHKQRITTLESDNASFQEQILRAYHRLKTDESTVQRARKAITIAAALLDEGFTPGETEPA